MKKLLIVVAAVAAVVTAQAKQLKVLAIGNSFSASMMRGLPNVAAAYPGCELCVANMMIGGCPLEKHWANVEKAATDPEFRPYGIAKSYAFDKEKGEKLPKRANIPEMLQADKWDIVTIQQASGQSPFYEKYQPYAAKLIAKIRELAPQAEIRIQQTWSYSPYDPRLKKWKMTPQTMYEALRGAYAKLAAENHFKIIPVADAVTMYRQQLPVKYEKVLTSKEIAAIEKPGTINFYHDVAGNSSWKGGRKGAKDEKEIKLRVDGSHLNPEGVYLQACVWLAALFEVDVTKLTYEPSALKAKEGFSERAKLMRECAAKAVEKLKVEG